MKKVFKLDKGTHWDDDEWQLGGHGLICHYGLTRFFDVPNKAKTIYVTVSDKVMPMSYRAQRVGFFNEYLRLSLPENPRKMWEVNTYTRLDMFLEYEGLEDFYVRLHHE